MKFWRLVAGRVNRLRLASVPMCLYHKSVSLVVAVACRTVNVLLLCGVV